MLLHEVAQAAAGAAPHVKNARDAELADEAADELERRGMLIAFSHMHGVVLRGGLGVILRLDFFGALIHTMAARIARVIRANRHVAEGSAMVMGSTPNANATRPTRSPAAEKGQAARATGWCSPRG